MTEYPVLVRPWLKNGLSVLLLENEARVRALCRAKSELVDSPETCREVIPKTSGKSGVRAPSSYRVASQKAADTSETIPTAQPVQNSDGDGQHESLASPVTLPVQNWQDSWIRLKDRKPLPPRPLVLWTYTGLGEDLIGTPDQLRRQVIVRMLMELHHPGGTHVFWPYVLPGECVGDRSEPSLFWSGVRLLNPRVILLFGSDTRDALSMPKTLHPFCQKRIWGRLIVQLPRPQSLASDEPLFQSVQAFLAQLLHFCALR